MREVKSMNKRFEFDDNDSDIADLKTRLMKDEVDNEENTDNNIKNNRRKKVKKKKVVKTKHKNKTKVKKEKQGRSVFFNNNFISTGDFNNCWNLRGWIFCL